MSADIGVLIGVCAGLINVLLFIAGVILCLYMLLSKYTIIIESYVRYLFTVGSSKSQL